MLSYTAALKANASYLPALIDRADALAELARDQEAVLDYESAVRKQADNAQLWLKLGVINDRLKRKDEAIRAYQKAVSINPNAALAYNNMTWLTIDEKSSLDQAQARSIKATTLAPNVPQFHDTLGWIYHARGELDLARKSLETDLGVVLQEQGKKKEAEEAFKRSLQIDRRFQGASDAERRLGELSK